MHSSINHSKAAPNPYATTTTPPPPLTVNMIFLVNKVCYLDQMEQGKKTPPKMSRFCLIGPQNTFLKVSGDHSDVLR